jgi:hypothetical protein
MSGLKPEFMDPFDDCAWLPARELFRRLGYEPAPPDQLDDFQLPGRLWEFIYALAGRRFYLDHTDLLSDRELYTWLHDQWFEEKVADIPYEAEWNCPIDVIEFGPGNDPVIWLRHFASEKERANFVAEHNPETLPPHKDPPYDRDRWLPVQPGPPSGDADEEPLPAEGNAEDDPLGLKMIDAEIQAEHGGDGGLASPECETWQRPIDQPRRTGAGPIPPDELTDETLAAKLWELLHHLACRGYFILSTDHQSDRELYTALWERGLRDDAILPQKKALTGGWFHDFLGGGSDEDTQIFLRYYASDEERLEHADTWPDDPMPPREKPPYHRDWRLPKGPF